MAERHGLLNHAFRIMALARQKIRPLKCLMAPSFFLQVQNYGAIMKDGEYNWSSPQSMSVSSDPAICAVTCDNGYHVVARCASRRSDLRPAYSQNGSDWDDGVTIIDNGQENDYPTVIQAPQNGMLHVTWTYGGRGAGGMAHVGYAIVDPGLLVGGQATSSNYKPTIEMHKENLVSLSKVKLFDIYGRIRKDIRHTNHLSEIDFVKGIYIADSGSKSRGTQIKRLLIH